MSSGVTSGVGDNGVAVGVISAAVTSGVGDNGGVVGVISSAGATGVSAAGATGVSVGGRVDVGLGAKGVCLLQLLTTVSNNPTTTPAIRFQGAATMALRDRPGALGRRGAPALLLLSCRNRRSLPCIEALDVR